jgi:hypothetical protein
MTESPPVAACRPGQGWIQRMGLVTYADGDPNRWFRVRYFNRADRAAGAVACISIWQGMLPPNQPAHRGSQDRGVEVVTYSPGIVRTAYVDLTHGDSTYQEVTADALTVGTPADAHQLVERSFKTYFGIDLTTVATDQPI